MFPPHPVGRTHDDSRPGRKRCQHPAKGSSAFVDSRDFRVLAQQSLASNEATRATADDRRCAATNVTHTRSNSPPQTGDGRIGQSVRRLQDLA
jgi:hypothetical protein